MSAEQIKALEAYSACDIADALLKLGVPGAGFLTDIKPIPSGPPPTPSQASIETQVPTQNLPTRIIAPASTALFLAKSSSSFPNAVPPLAAITQTISQALPNIPSGVPYADLTPPNTILVISQPSGQSCAVVGGIMAARMHALGAKGVVVDGRVRDLSTLRELGIPIWSKGTSIIGAGAESKAWAMGEEIDIRGVSVRPGDLVMIDYVENGIVCIPEGAVGKVLEILPGLVSADEGVMKDVLAGGEVGVAFKKWRG